MTMSTKEHSELEQRLERCQLELERERQLRQLDNQEKAKIKVRMKQNTNLRITKGILCCLTLRI